MNHLAAVVYTFFGFSVFLVIYGVSGLFIRKKLLKDKFMVKGSELMDNDIYYRILSHPHLKKFRTLIEERAEFSGTKWSFGQYLAYSFLCCMIGVGIAVIYMNNILAAIPLGLVLFLTPLGYLNHFTVKKQRLMEKQFMPALQQFITEYGSTKNIISVLNNIEAKLDYPLQEEFSRLGRELNSGNPPDKTLLNFAKRLNNSWGYKFAHILNLRFTKGIEITPILFSMLMEMKTKTIQARQRSMEMVGVKAENLVLYLSIPVMYVFASKVNPKSHLLLTQTASGKKAMFVMLCILLAGIAGTIWINNNKIES